MIRAFSYFSHLANIAEDRHHVRRRLHHERQGHLQEGSLAHDRAAAPRRHPGGIAPTTNTTSTSPVLTAHPTEVQRKSILDAEHDIARLLAERDQPLTPRNAPRNLQLLHACIATLWQTRMLRYTKLTVADEIENALSYYRITFLRECRPVRRHRSEIAVQYPAGDAQAAVPAKPPICRWAAGSAATATATRTSNAGTMQHALVPGHDHPRFLPGRSARAGRRAVDLDPGIGVSPACRRWPMRRPTSDTAPTNPTAAP